MNARVTLVRMDSVIAELRHLTENYFTELKTISEPEFSFKPGPLKWSRKEIIGHLIDSAQNNIRRFIVAQYEDQAVIVYNQDEWVRLNGYQNQDSQLLAELWYLLNKQICHILERMPEEGFQRLCTTDSSRSVGWLATDYVKHLKHHMHVVLNREEVPYP